VRLIQVSATEVASLKARSQIDIQLAQHEKAIDETAVDELGRPPPAHQSEIRTLVCLFSQNLAEHDATKVGHPGFRLPEGRVELPIHERLIRTAQRCIIPTRP
jgi:hypothetical protein